MINSLKEFMSHKVARQASELLGWQLVTKFIAFFTTAWMVRCMGPENLGVSGMIIATASGFSLFINLGHDIVGTRKIAVAKASSSDIIELVIGLRWRMAGLFFLIWTGYCFYLMLNKSPYFIAWSLGAVFMATNSLNTGWILQGMEELPLQNRVMSITSVMTAAIYVAFFRPGMPAGADIAAIVASNIVGLIVMWRYVKKKTGASIFGRFNIRDAKGLVYEGRWAFFIAFTVYVYLQLDMILVARFASLEQAGAYRAAISLISPIAILTSISGTLLYPRLAVWYQQNPESMWIMQKKIALSYLFIGAGLCGIMFIAGPPLVKLLFGDRFEAAIMPFLILLASKVLVLISGVFGWGIMASGRDKRFFVASFSAAMFSLGSNICFVPAYGAVAAACTNFVSEGIVVLLTICFCRQIVLARLPVV